MIIKDTLISPYYIKTNGQEVILLKEKTVKEGKNAGNTVESTVGYYQSVEGALSKVARMKVAEDSKDTITIKEYVDALSQIKNDIANTINQ